MQGRYRDERNLSDSRGRHSSDLSHPGKAKVRALLMAAWMDMNALALGDAGGAARWINRPFARH